jgi:neutral amino acid transport system substrate-binding protein
MIGKLKGGGAAATVSLLALVIASCGSTSTTGGSKVGPINLGEVFPLTGAIAGPGMEFIDGAHVAVADINAHGGVLGQKINEFVGDDSGDAVDAVPALRQLLTNNLTFLSGPLSPTFPALENIIVAQKIPDFAGIPSAQFDTLSQPYIFRTVVSDSVLGTAMAYYAISKGYMNCSFLFENVQSAQGLIQPIETAYTAHGGKVDDVEELVPHASSYRTEIEKAFADNPQCVFDQTDDITSPTLFSQMNSLGHLNVPIVGTDELAGATVAKAVGYPTMNKWVTGMAGANPSGPSYSYFSSLYMTKYGTAPTNFGASTYDGVIIGALAMTIAGTTDGHVWVNDITKVTSNQSGTACTSYSACVALIKAGTPMYYTGASGPMVFDSHHSVYTGIDVENFSLSGDLQQVVAITPQELNGY